MSKFLTEIRKIIREEISIALDEVVKKTDQRIVEVLSKRLVESKKQKQVAPPAKSQQKPAAKSDKDLIRQVKESLNKNTSATPKRVVEQRTPKRTAEDLLPDTLKGLPPSLREALVQTTEDLLTGNTPRLDSSDMYDSYNMIDDTNYVMESGPASHRSYGMGGLEEMDEWPTISRTSADVAQSMPVPAMNTSGMPDFLSSAISRAGAVAKRAEEFSKTKVG